MFRGTCVLAIKGTEIHDPIESRGRMSSAFDALMEVMFMILFLQSMNASIKLPVTIIVISMGAFFMDGNVTATNSIKHVDIGYKYANEHVEDGMVKIVCEVC